MFCRFGSTLDSRPVAAMVWLKVVCTRPSSSTIGSSESTTDFSRVTSRWRSSKGSNGLSLASASQARASASVV